ncbi:MAG: tRNA lysidine(34) synthetase TilS [Acidobacteria bacterium]|nr:tRNA lysidine(34) synthetase TilS [Acidobacteriota bacterium]MBS1866334.1 tRNA lysidine(34) synthetase TilS [Acidobacteriota bacterium]
MLRAGERVGIAVSGGVDSVALLRLMVELREELGIVLSVVHFNHKLRGKASDKDEAFVAGLAEKFGLTLHVGRGDVGKKAKQEKRNLEDAARRARYAFFKRLTDGGLADCVATAHTADDQAETVLAHILRGTGLAGLAGIHPVTKDGIVRPLLGVRRGELRKYLRGKKQAWREDATNQDDSRQRARMRKKLLPLLEKEFNPQAVEHLGALAELTRKDEALLSALAEAGCGTLAEERGAGKGIEARKLLLPDLNVFLNAESTELSEKKKQESRALSARMVRLLVNECKETGSETAAVHVDAVLRLAESGENGKVLQLPGGVDVRRDDDWLVFLRRDARGAKKKAPVEFEYTVTLLGDAEVNVAVKEISCVIRFRSIDWHNAQRETIKKGWAALDRDKLQGALRLRNLRPGDRMRPTGHSGTHKLKRLLNEKRISRWEREGWPVLENGKTIVWARGFVVAEFAATRETRKAILVSEEKA